MSQKKATIHIQISALIQTTIVFKIIEALEIKYKKALQGVPKKRKLLLEFQCLALKLNQRVHERLT